MSVDSSVSVPASLTASEEDEEADGGLGSRGLDSVCIGAGERTLRPSAGRADAAGCGG